MQLVFNELSLNETMAKRDGIRCFCSFLDTYSHAVKNGFGRAVLTYIDFNAVPIADGYYSFQWRNSEADRDMVRRFQGLCERQHLFLSGKQDEKMLYMQFDNKTANCFGAENEGMT